MFAARWRWNLNRALVVLRMKKGKKNPPPIQRMESDDVMAAVFPALAQCQENATGPIEIPDHPLVRQTLDDCLHEAMDVRGLEALLDALESRSVRLHFRDSTEPSPLSHEILNSRPYTFLDDAPLEERRTRAVRLTRGLPVDPRQLTKLDPEAIKRVREEARPAPENADELYDLLLALVVCRPDAALGSAVHGARADRRVALRLDSPIAGTLWCALENRALGRGAVSRSAVRSRLALLPDARAKILRSPRRRRPRPCAAISTCSARLRPTRSRKRPACRPTLVHTALARLELEGFALRGIVR